MTTLRFGINFGYWQNIKAAHWPDWPALSMMDLDDIDQTYREEVKCRHNYEPSYHPSMMTVARHCFPGLEKINGSFSQSMQDIFVLTLLDGKNNGTYLELGSFEPVCYNNTYLLTRFGWTGISIDISADLKQHWQDQRPNDNFMCCDALSLDYDNLLKNANLPDQIDYLQIDIDQGQGDVDVLEKILDTGKRFSVITFEHEQDFKAASSRVLQSHGYELLVENIACKDFRYDTWHVFEDWWIDPMQIDQSIQDKFRNIDVKITYAFENFCTPGSVSHLMPAVLDQKDIWTGSDQ